MTLNGLNACHSDVFLNPENVARDAQQIIRMVRKHWREEDVKFERCTMSFVNRVSKAYVPDSEDAALIFRVYPRGQFDSTVDKLQEQQITRLLNELKICPRVNCIFQNGVCFDHVVGDILDWTDFSPLDDVCFAKCCVRELASFHSNKTRDLALSKYGIKEENIMPGHFESLLKLYPQEIPSTEEEILKRIPTFQTLRSELDVATGVIEDLGLPLVLCHHDTNPTNIIYNKKLDKSTLVDYDVTGFGFAAYDLAYFLVTLGLGSNPAGPDSPRRQPSYWKDVLREYLKTKRQLDDSAANNDDVTELEIEKLYAQVRKASMVRMSEAAMLLYVLLYLVDSTLPKAPYGSPSLFLRMSGDLYTDRYLKEKGEIMQLKVPE